MTSVSKGDNPILKMDFPDPDVIFVDGIYYMISTTMHFLPGGQILRSYDLIHWEHASYVFDRLDSTAGQTLTDDQYIYGKGMWAASLRYHKGTFYVMFVCNDTQKTYLFRAERIEGPWRKQVVEGFYHDCSLLFDDDDRIYVVYGNRKIYLTELNAEMTGPKEGGLHRLLLSDCEETSLGYEGSHLYKIDGRYYLFMIHSIPERWRRVEACFSSDSLEGTFQGGDILNDDMGFRDSGVAQGGIVCGVDGIWHAVLFQDSGAVGRIPVLVPVTWTEEGPIFGVEGEVPKLVETLVSPACPNEDYHYAPLSDDDDFRYGFRWGESQQIRANHPTRESFSCFGLRDIWQFNHEPNLDLIFRDEAQGRLWIRTDKLSLNLNHARNTITQRTVYPYSCAEVDLDVSKLRDGDCAGLCILQGDYCWVGVEKKGATLYATMYTHTSQEGTWDLSPVRGDVMESLPLEVGEQLIRLRVEVDFADEKDEATCQILRRGTREKGGWRRIGAPHKLLFRLDHFTGARFGLFIYSQKEIGGEAGFSDFRFSTEKAL